MAEKVPATVISGFLGAGKTTLIRNLIEGAEGKRFAFLINEFGDLGMDRETLLGCGIEGCEDDDVIELANGCICCTVADDFLPAMQTILDRDAKPDHIIIETSGLALPKPLVKAFNWPEIKAQVTVDGVITVVDGKAVSEGRFADDEDAVEAQRQADEALDHDNPLEEVFTDQLHCADLIVLNKTDLLDAEQKTALADSLSARVRDGVSVVPALHAQVDRRILLGLDAAAEDDLQARPSHHDGHDDHDHDDFDTVALTLGPIADIDAFEAALAQVIADQDLLRVKGFLDRPDLPRREVVQAVGPRIQRYFDRDWRADEARRSDLVFIGLHGFDIGAVTSALTPWLAD